MAGALGLWLAWRRVVAANRQSEAAILQAETASRQALLARREHVAELFSTAAGQLGDDKLEVRLAAIYTLREIGRDFPDLTAAVFDLLSAYVRSKAFDYGDAEPPPDVAALFEILTARTKAS